MFLALRFLSQGFLYFIRKVLPVRYKMLCELLSVSDACLAVTEVYFVSENFLNTERKRKDGNSRKDSRKS